MKRTLVTIAGTTALVTFALGSPAAAADPVAGCGKGNPMMTVGDGLAMIDWRIYTPEERAELEPLFRELVDVNGDGYLCVHLLPAAAGKKTPFDPLFRVSDNGQGNPNSLVVNEPQPRPVGS